MKKQFSLTRVAPSTWRRPKSNFPALFLSLAALAGVNQTVAQTLTNITVTPANPVIAVGSNVQFTANGRYSDGTSHVLTNANGTGGSWGALASMPVGKDTTAQVAFNGKLYVLEGHQSSVLVYNPVTDQWVNEATLGTRTDAGGVVVGTNIYVIGGCINGNCTFISSGVDVYNVITKTGVAGVALPYKITGLSAAAINGKIYSAGGFDQNNSPINALLVLDPATDSSWTAKASMPTARNGASITVINGKIYVAGGTGTSGVITGALEVYDPVADAWTSKTPMPTPRTHLGSCAANGLLYAINGVTATGVVTNLVEVYNPATDTWSAGAPTLYAHAGFQPVAINGTIYVAGSVGGGQTTQLEAFTPSIPIVWSSGSPAVASVGTNGLAAGVAAGTDTITATLGSVSNTTILTVVAPPTISIQPTNNTVSTGGSVTLSVGATGGALGYQWQFNASNIPGATGATLTISNVSATNIGVYSVIVNNAAGSLTSASVAITSVDIHMLASVYVDGPIGSNYLIQASPNLAGGWTTLTNITLPSRPYIYVDYSSETNHLQFYRAVPQ